MNSFQYQQVKKMGLKSSVMHSLPITFIRSHQIFQKNFTNTKKRKLLKE